MKKIILLQAMLLSLISCNKTPLKKTADYIKENHSKTVILSDFTNFKWDETWLISGSIGGDYIKLMKEQNINVKKIENSKNTEYGISKDYFNTIVYVYNKEVVYYEFSPDTREIFSLAPKQPSALLDFKISRGQIIVLSKDNSICNVEDGELVPINPIKIYQIE